MMDVFSGDFEIKGLIFGRPLSTGMWAVIVLVVLVGAVLLYRRERGLKPWIRLALAATRITVLLLLIAALCEPALSVRETREERPSLAVLVDASQSMSVRDQRKRAADISDAAVALGYITADQGDSATDIRTALNTKQEQAIATASRMDLARSLLSKSGAPTFDFLSEAFGMRFYAFGQSVDLLGYGGDNTLKAIADLRARRQGSSIADAIEQIAHAHQGEPLAGIVLLSDGIETSARDPEAVAYSLGVRGIPVYTVPMGVSEPDDISIRNVIVQDVAFVGDTVPVRIQVLSRGYEKRTTELVVHFDGKEVARRVVTLEGGLQYVDMAFDALVGDRGAVNLDIKVEPFTNEATADNNSATKSIRIVDEKINVLCIEGSARWEFRYLRAILKRDPRIRSTFIATRAGNELAMHSSDYIARFPEDAEDAFKYDLVILGDVDSGFFTSAELSRLESLVRDRGGSLLMLAGPKFSPCSYAGTPVERMLPVRFSAQDSWRAVDRDVHPVLTAEGRSSLVLTLERDRDKNDRIWTHVAPMGRIPPLLARPGASVLAALSDNGVRVGLYPVISWQRYGTGKCMLIATDRLWRLRFRTGDKYHWRVWSQCTQFLTLSRLMGEHRQIRMETDRVTYPVGDQVRVYAEVLDAAYEPVLRERYDVVVSLVRDDTEPGAENRISLRPDSTRPGLYVGYYVPPAAGRYRIQAGKEDRDFANTIEFQVADSNPEMARTGMQLERLRRIARISGGACLSAARLRQLASSLDATPRRTEVQREIPIWDHWFFVLLIVVLAGLEWIVRRRYDLL